MVVLRRDLATDGELADPRSALHAWAAAHEQVHVDLGTGDGRFAVDLARRRPHTAVIGLDATLDHLRGSRKRYPGNLRFVAADALTWPLGTLPVATAVTVNFPYGSLLRGLVAADPGLLERLGALLGPRGRIEVRLNATALVAGGLDPCGAPAAVAAALRRLGGMRVCTRALDQAELRAFPSSWAKRIGHGRKADAWLIAGSRCGDAPE